MGEEAMQIEFEDTAVQEAARGVDSGPLGWTRPELAQLRLLVQCLEAGEVVQDVASMRCLQLSPKGAATGSFTASLSAGRQMQLEFATRGQELTAVIGSSRAARGATR